MMQKAPGVWCVVDVRDWLLWLLSDPLSTCWLAAAETVGRDEIRWPALCTHVGEQLPSNVDCSFHANPLGYIRWCGGTPRKIGR